MKRASFLTLVAILCISGTVNAQFSKPLQSSHNQFYSSEAKYNIGLIGGATMTHWLHIGGTRTKYNQPFNYGLTGGVFIERMQKKDFSIGLEAMYAMRNTQLNYEVLNFPSSLTSNDNFYKQLDVAYQEIYVQVPFTRYLGQGNNIKPFVFAAPRITVPLSGQMLWQREKIQNYGTENQQYEETTPDTVAMSAQNMRPWNVGIVAGAGVRFKISLGNYYIFTKVDASYHVGLVNSFSHDESQGTSANVIGAGYIDPYLLGMRFNTDVTAKITLLFPLKKQLQGACMRWGEYD